MEVYIHGIEIAHPDRFEELEVTQLVPRSFSSGSINLDTESPYFPDRSDQKIMRSDTKMAVVIVQELLSKLNFEIDKKRTGLFVASGVFIEDLNKHLGHLLRVFETIKSSQSEQEKLKMIYKASPPLLALQTLTNGTMSFVAQYTQIKGNNATFGTTSLGGFQAIEEACFESQFKGNSAIAVASNIGGEYSFMSNSSLVNDIQDWKESSSAGTILIGNSKENAICRITELKSSEAQYSLEEKQISQTWSSLISNRKADATVHSGAYTKTQYQADKNYLSEFRPTVTSDFESYGNMGPVNVFSSIQTGIQHIRNGARIVDVLDRDVYGRESLIRLESCD